MVRGVHLLRASSVVAILWLAGGCEPAPSSLLIRVTSGDPPRQFDALSVAVFDPHGRIAGGSFSPATLPGAVEVVNLQPRASTLRVVARGEGAQPTLTGVLVTTRPGALTVVALDLSSSLPDADRDGVPDSFDLCPLVPDPDQASAAGGAPGDACAGESRPDLSTPDGSVPDGSVLTAGDLSVLLPEDAGVPVEDLSALDLKDGATPDQSLPSDLAMPDLKPSSDLAMPDLKPAADMVAQPDMVAPPDMVVPPDLKPPPDLTPPVDLAGVLLTDDFASGSLDGAKWNVNTGNGGTSSLSGGQLVLKTSTAAASFAELVSTQSFGVGVTLEAQITVAEPPAPAYEQRGIGFANQRLTSACQTGETEAAMLRCFNGTFVFETKTGNTPTCSGSAHAYPTGTHTFKIVRVDASRVDFYVDGTEDSSTYYVSTQSLPVRIGVFTHDTSATGGPVTLSVDWVHVTSN